MTEQATKQALLELWQEALEAAKEGERFGLVSLHNHIAGLRAVIVELGWNSPLELEAE